MWRSMRTEDLAHVVPLADRLFPDHPEDAERFAERLGRGGDLCLTLASSDGAVTGYAVAYPWPLGHVPPLNRPLDATEAPCGTVYLHDLGVSPEMAGAGHAGAGLSLLRERAGRAGYAAIALVAVNGSAGFWQARGFQAQPMTRSANAKLASYGADARYMVLML